MAFRDLEVFGAGIETAILSKSQIQGQLNLNIGHKFIQQDYNLV